MTLDLVCFFSFRSNGTTAIAEVHRAIMRDREYYFERYNDHDGTFYEFLFEVCKKVNPNHCPGSCTSQRCNFSAGSNNTVWSVHRKRFLKLFKKFGEWGTESSNFDREHCERVTMEIIDYISTAKKRSDKSKKKFLGASDFSTIQFIQMSALLGLIPPYCATYIELRSDSLGPSKFIQAGLKKKLSSEECNDFLKTVHGEVTDIWGNSITLSLMENLLCELNRCYNATSSRLQPKKEKGKKRRKVEYDVDIITDPSKFVDSRTKDVLYKDEMRGCMQNLFILKFNGRGASSNKPMLVMKHTPDWDLGDSKCNISLTNWMCNNVDPCHMKWSDAPIHRTLKTKLSVSDFLKEKMQI